MRPMKDSSATGGGCGRMNLGPLSSNPDETLIRHHEEQAAKLMDVQPEGAA